MFACGGRDLAVAPADGGAEGAPQVTPGAVSNLDTLSLTADMSQLPGSGPPNLFAFLNFPGDESFAELLTCLAS